MQRASPSWPANARRCSCALSSCASVAMTPMVVLVPGRANWGRSPLSRLCAVLRRALPSAVRAPASMLPSGARTSPTALTAIRAPTVTPCTLTLAEPMPPFMAQACPNSLPTVAPAPAPTLPVAQGVLVAASQAARPAAASGRMEALPTGRSNNTAAGTMGTRPTPTSRPYPCSSSHSATPVAADRPQALPPLSTMACTCSTRFPGRSRSVSRVPGAAPRTSTAATAPSGVSTTLHPVGRRSEVKCPTCTPCTRVMQPESGRGEADRVICEGRGCQTRWPATGGGRPRKWHSACRS